MQINQAQRDELDSEDTTDDDFTSEQRIALERIARNLKDAKEHEAQAEDLIDGSRKEIWEIADEYAQNSLRKRITEEIQADSEQEARDLAGVRFPMFDVDLVEPAQDGELWRVYMTEAPAFCKFSYESELGFKVGRTVSQAADSFDCEAFVRDHPELAVRIMSVTESTTTHPDGVEVTSERIALHEPSLHVLIAEEPEVAPVLADYVIPGKVTVKLLPTPKPKKVKR